MRRNAYLLLFVAIVVLVALVVSNGDRIYGWLLALHNGKSTH